MYGTVRYRAESSALLSLEYRSRSGNPAQMQTIDCVKCVSVTFCANSGFPDSLLRCMNSRCSVPYSARMLLPPDAQGQFLPIPLHREKERGGEKRALFNKEDDKKTKAAGG